MKKLLVYFAGNINDPKGTPNRVRTLVGILRECGFHIFFAGKIQPDFIEDDFFLKLPHPLKRFNFLRTKIKQHEIDIVYFQTSAHITLLAALARVAGIPCGCDIHGLIHEEELYYGSISQVRYFFDKRIDFLAASQLQFATGVCGSLKKYYQHVIPKFEVLSAVADQVFFDLTGDVSENVMQWKKNRVVIGYAGNANEYQGVDILIQAMKIIEKKQPSAFGLVLIVSSGLNGVKKLIDDAELSEQTLLLGRQPHENMPGLLRACDILTIPRRSEPITEYAFPSKIAEYAALGKALVVTEVGDMSLYIQNGVNGFIVQQNNPDKLADALLQLQNSNIRAQLGVRLHKTALKEFHPEAFKIKFNRFFNSLT